MQTSVIKYQEPLDKQEISFLVGKEQKERRIYFKVFRILMVVSFVMPFIGAWYRAYDGGPNAFSYSRFFVAVSVLLFISFFSTYFIYRYNLRLLQQDLKHTTKVIEVVKINRKTQVPQNNSYHFYITSALKLSVEVSQEYFNRLNEGDELCIEYTSYSQEFLGYF